MGDPVHVLLVEDDDADALLATRHLGSWPRHDFRVERATTLSDVTRKFRPEHDLVILDLDLPDSRGMETLREVLVRCHDRPVVVLSQHAAEEDAFEAMREGADDYVCKSEMSDISRAAAFALERYRVTHSARAAAVVDELTGLPNRVLFQDRLDSALRRARRYGHGVAVLYLDLDGFKPINDTHGHAIGDLVLRKVGERVTRVLRAADTVARLGGDEFGVVLEEVGGEPVARAVATKILSEVRRPIQVRSRASGRGMSLEVSCSIGIALHPEHGRQTGTLVRCADLAMYEAKWASGGSIAVYAGAGSSDSTDLAASGAHTIEETQPVVTDDSRR